MNLSIFLASPRYPSMSVSPVLRRLQVCFLHLYFFAWVLVTKLNPQGYAASTTLTEATSLHPYFLLFCLFILDKVLLIFDWFWNCHIAQDDLELLVPLLLSARIADMVYAVPGMESRIPLIPYKNSTKWAAVWPHMYVVLYRGWTPRLKPTLLPPGFILRSL